MSEEVKNFQFDVKPVGPLVIGTFVINGETYSVRPLKSTHVAYLVRAAQRKRNETAIVSAVIDFMEQALTGESSDRFEALILGDPGLELDEVVEVFTHVLDIVTRYDPEGNEKPAATSRAARRSGNPAIAKG